MSGLEQRIEVLERAMAHQDRTIEELNAVVADQWRQIDLLKRQLARLDDQLREVESGLPAQPNQRPPHY
jgi:SlyX protein